MFDNCSLSLQIDFLKNNLKLFFMFSTLLTKQKTFKKKHGEYKKRHIENKQKNFQTLERCIIQ